MNHDLKVNLLWMLVGVVVFINTVLCIGLIPLYYVLRAQAGG